MPISHDPKLQKAMTLILAIIREYDIAGAVMLHNKGMIEHGDIARGVLDFQLVLDPSWSAIEQTTTERGTALVIRGHRKHYGDDTIKRDKALSRSLNMVNMLGEQMGRTSLQIMDMSKSVDKVWQAEHRDDDTTTGTTSLN